MRSQLALMFLTLTALALLSGCPEVGKQVTDAADDTAAAPASQQLHAANASAPKPELTTTKFKVEGMTCEDCSKSIESELIKIEGVTTVSADHKNGATIVQYDASKVETQQLIAAIDSLKYKAAVVQ